jgi:hypothetical protein
MFVIPLVSTHVYWSARKQLLTLFPSFWLLAACPPSFLELQSRPSSRVWLRENLPILYKIAVHSNTLSMEAQELFLKVGRP